MKTKTIRFLALALTLALIVGAISSVSAAKYVSKPVSESFEAKTEFLQPGDVDIDGDVDDQDYTSLREMLLYNAASLYSDTNGDEITNICDLVLQKANKDVEFLKDGKMNLNGRSVYGKNINSLLNSGAEYKITYTASGDVTVKLDGINDADITASGATFKTPTNLKNTDVLLYVIGEGSIESLTISRTNMDNDFSVK